MIRLGVCGWPVAHSRSPQMHNAALKVLGLDDWHYQLLPLPPHLFTETVKALPALGFRGVNVTIPHKEAALALADRATETARAIGAANTLTFEPDGTIHADNTDAPGFLAALNRSAYDRTALVLGAGGTARAVLYALRQAGVRELRVWNRTRGPRAGACRRIRRAGRRRAGRHRRQHAPRSGSATPRTRSRRSPSEPMNWVPDARWWTWSTGTAAPSC